MNDDMRVRSSVEKYINFLQTKSPQGAFLCLQFANDLEAVKDKKDKDYRNLAYLYWVFGKYHFDIFQGTSSDECFLLKHCDKALSSYTQAINYREAVKDKSDEDHQQLALYVDKVNECYRQSALLAGKKGDTYFLQKRYEEALSFYKKAIKYQEAVNNKSDEDHSLLYFYHCYVGNVYFKQEHYLNVKKYYEQAVACIQLHQNKQQLDLSTSCDDVSFNPCEVWAQFHEHLTKTLQSYQHLRDRHHHKCDTRSFDQKHKDAAKVIQQWWKEIRCSQNTFPINPQGNHTDEFMDFIAKVDKPQVLRKLLNTKVLDDLLQAINVGNYRAEVFKTSKLLEATLSLYASNKINRQQIATIIQLQQLNDVFREVCSYQIIDDQGRFTEEAKQWLLPYLQSPIKLPGMSDNQIKKWGLLLRELPASERFFWYARRIRKEAYHGWLNLNDIAGRLSPPKQKFPIYIVHLSVSAQEAFGLVMFGVEHYVPVVYRLGNLTMHDIEYGQSSRGVRYGILTFPGVPCNKNIHGTLIVPYELTAHDIVHSIVCSTQPIPMRKAMDRMIQVVRDSCGKQYSREIWMLIDREFQHFFKHRSHSDAIADVSALFCQWIKASQYISVDTNDTKSKVRMTTRPLMGLFFDGSQNTGSVSVMGGAVLIDMVKNVEEWTNLGIDPHQFKDEWLMHFNIVNSIKDSFGENHITNIIKIFIYYSLSESDKGQYRTLLPDIDSTRDIETLFSIDKTSKTNSPPKVELNRLALTYSKAKGKEYWIYSENFTGKLFNTVFKKRSVYTEGNQAMDDRDRKESHDLLSHATGHSRVPYHAGS